MALRWRRGGSPCWFRAACSHDRRASTTAPTVTGRTGRGNVTRNRERVRPGRSLPSGHKERPCKQHDRRAQRRYDDEQDRQRRRVGRLRPWRIIIAIEPASANHHSLYFRRQRRATHHFAEQRIREIASARALTGGPRQGLRSAPVDAQSDRVGDPNSPRDVASSPTRIASARASRGQQTRQRRCR
jgi:hypothetical protein